MQKWEYAVYCWDDLGSKGIRNIGIYTSANLWKNQNREGKTGIDIIREFGEKGYELVNAVPIENAITSGYSKTHEILFVFKRPMEDS
ncbi:MAG TPA: hypothetical protein PKJ47_07165 [Candidatus Limiplasma sp.]|nr:hypothetical protein [Candidatus Limiplasma sp.]